MVAVAMRDYRYFLLSRKRRISDSEELACQTDGEAVVIAEEILRRRTELDRVELWSSTHRIHNAEPTGLK
jgi:hypothetical protein